MKGITMQKLFSLNLNLYEKIWFDIFGSIGVVLPIIWNETPIGFIAFFSGIICVLMAAKGLRLNYAVGVVNCIAYSYVSFQSGLYGEVMLNMLYYLPMQFIGFYISCIPANCNDNPPTKLRK